MRPYDEFRQFTPNPEGGSRSIATLFDNRQQKNSECRELRAWKQSPLDSDHVLILTASLTRTDKVLRTQLFAKWSFVLVYPTSLIRHKSKYSIIFPYLWCNVSECETIIYYAKYRLILQSRSNGDTEACHHILICWEAPVCIYIYIYIYV